MLEEILEHPPIPSEALTSAEKDDRRSIFKANTSCRVNFNLDESSQRELQSDFISLKLLSKRCQAR